SRHRVRVTIADAKEAATVVSGCPAATWSVHNWRNSPSSALRELDRHGRSHNANSSGRGHVHRSRCTLLSRRCPRPNGWDPPRGRRATPTATCTHVPATVGLFHKVTDGAVHAPLHAQW